MPVSCHFQGCKALLRIVKRRYIKYYAFAYVFALELRHFALLQYILCAAFTERPITNIEKCT